MLVRPATSEELPEVAQMLHDFNREFGEPCPEPSWLAERLSSFVAGGETVVLVAAELHGLALLRIRANLWSAANEAYLAELYVRPGERGRGIGRALLEGAIAAARDRGCDYMDLNTAESDVAARALYESAGFSRTEGRADGPLCFYYERSL